MVLGVLFLGALAGAVIVFLDSGADSGVVTLEVADAYERGSAQFLGAQNVYLVRLRDGSFLALSDLDAANRANQQQRCRVTAINPFDPALGQALERFASKVSPDAAGARFVLRETCNGAHYDLTGWRLDASGPPLDRYATGTDEQGRVTIDLSRRRCAPANEAPFQVCR